MSTLFIKSILAINAFLLFLYCSNNTSEHKLQPGQLKPFGLHYNLTRIMCTGNSTSSKQIITNGAFYGSDSFSLTKNERVLYLREHSNCLIMGKTLPMVVHLDTLNAVSYLSSEPANDIFLLLKLVSSLNSSSEIIGSKTIKNKYFIGNESRNIDSVYLTYLVGKNFPDQIIYISKQVGANQSVRSFIIDSLKIIRLDTIPQKPNTNSIEEYLNSDSIKKRHIIKFNTLQKFLPQLQRHN